MGYPAIVQYPIPPKQHPHRDVGVVLLGVGIAGIVAGVILAAYCAASFFGVCLDNPYAGYGGLLILLGIVLLIVGFILMFESSSGVQAVVVSQQNPQSFAPPPPPPVHPGIRFCPSCGGASARSAGFCNRCGKPLPPPPV